MQSLLGLEAPCLFTSNFGVAALHHTRLEPPHRHPVGECTSSVATAVICFLSSGGWSRSLVMQDQMDVSPLSRGVMLPVGATPIAG